MPIRELTATDLIQTCAHCAGTHTIPLMHGCSKGKRGPYVSLVGQTLEIAVDRNAAQAVEFAAQHFSDPTNPRVHEVVDRINAVLVGATADADQHAPRICSHTTGVDTTSIQVAGAARELLGFYNRRYGARRLGVTKGSGPQAMTDVNIIDLPHCPECGAKECLIRTFDVTPSAYAASAHVAHRKCVNALAEYLKEHGYSDADSVAVHQHERDTPREIDLTFPGSAITLVPFT